MITKKLLYVNIPGGVAQFLGTKREDFEKELTDTFDASLITELNSLADRVTTQLLTKFADTVDPGLMQVLRKYVQMSVGMSAHEADSILEEKTGLTDINRSTVIKAIKAEYKTGRKKNDVCTKASLDESLSDFEATSPEPINVDIDSISPDEFFN